MQSKCEDGNEEKGSTLDPTATPINTDVEIAAIGQLPLRQLVLTHHVGPVLEDDGGADDGETEESEGWAAAVGFFLGEFRSWKIWRGPGGCW